MTQKATAWAPANIAFIKFWGKRDEKLRLPMNSSVSFNLSNVFTVTTVEFDKNLVDDEVKLDGKIVDGKEKDRITKYLDKIRNIARVSTRAKVESKNNFPVGTGMASSASGFAALSLAASSALGLRLNKRKLSILARIGSGSACRSIPDGWVEWKEAGTSEGSYAYSMYSQRHWGVCDVVAIVESTKKSVSSTEGHALVESSPFYKCRIGGMRKKLKMIKKAIGEKKFSKFGEILEAEAINMHTVMMTSEPALIYWTPETLRIILKIKEWRERGLEVYFTIDAGPNVHVICLEKDARKIERLLRTIEGVKMVVVNQVARGTHLV